MKNRFAPCLASSLLALALALAAPAANAQEPGPQSNAKKAEAQYNIAKRAEDLGNLRLASIHYKKAYDLYPTPALLYTLAHVHRLLGDQKIALDYYERYAVADPNGPRIAAAKKYIKILKEALEQKIPLPPEDDDDDGGGTRGGNDGSEAPPVKTDPDAGSSGGGGGDPSAPPTGPADTPSRGHTLRWVGVGIGAVGAAGLITGTLFGLKAQSLADDINNPGTMWDQEELDAFQEGEDAERNQIIFTIGGAALVATGITLVIIDAMGGDSGDGATVATPTVGRDSLGLAVSGRF